MVEKVMKEKGKSMATEDDGDSPKLEDRLESLNLQGEEEEDLDFSNELDDLVKDVH
jgi:hypothetical protein